jgi:hypothetical protein
LVSSLRMVKPPFKSRFNVHITNLTHKPFTREIKVL